MNLLFNFSLEWNERISRKRIRKIEQLGEKDEGDFLFYYYEMLTTVIYSKKEEVSIEILNSMVKFDDAEQSSIYTLQYWAQAGKDDRNLNFLYFLESLMICKTQRARTFLFSGWKVTFLSLISTNIIFSFLYLSRKVKFFLNRKFYSIHMWCCYRQLTKVVNQHKTSCLL